MVGKMLGDEWNEFVRIFRMLRHWDESFKQLIAFVHTVSWLPAYVGRNVHKEDTGVEWRQLFPSKTIQ
jgi:hypothetical protein